MKQINLWVNTLSKKQDHSITINLDSIKFPPLRPLEKIS